MAIGMLSGLLFFSGSYQMQRASARMSEIRSRGGETIDEAYFHQVGEQGGAASTALVACGFAIIGISVGLGGLLICLPNEESV